MLQCLIPGMLLPPDPPLISDPLDERVPPPRIKHRCKVLFSSHVQATIHVLSPARNASLTRRGPWALNDLLLVRGHFCRPHRKQIQRRPCAQVHPTRSKPLRRHGVDRFGKIGTLLFAPGGSTLRLWAKDFVDGLPRSHDPKRAFANFVEHQGWPPLDDSHNHGSKPGIPNSRPLVHSRRIAQDAGRRASLRRRFQILSARRAL